MNKILRSLGVFFTASMAILLFASLVYAMDLGPSPTSTGQSSNESSGSDQVEVSNLPIQQLVKKVNNEDVSIPHVRVLDADNYTQEVAKEVTLPFGETFESDPIDVREYRDVAFYVIPDLVITDQVPPVYRLDAYFSILPGTQKIQKMGEAGKDISSNGWQEFGSMGIDEEKKELQTSFHKLTTGETSSRVLTTKVYGPFIRVVLKNLTPDSKRKFRIVAYLSR